MSDPAAAWQRSGERRVLFVRAGDALVEEVGAEDAILGVEVERAAGPREALDALQRRPCDVVITVAGAGGMQADLAFARDLAEAQPTAKTIILAPSPSPQDLIDALRQQIFGCFSTPVDVHDLAAMLQVATITDEWRHGIEVLSGVPTWITLRVSSEMATAERLLRFMAELRVDLQDGDRHNLMAALREMLINAMEHGAGFDPGKQVEVTAARTPRAIVYYLRDPGPGFRREDLTHAAVGHGINNPIAHLERRAELGLRPGGYGMLLTKDLVDELVYNERGNEVILVKYTDADGRFTTGR
jgi:anti-sigma regulatory factor (Ser/Thr protein kinase)